MNLMAITQHGYYVVEPEEEARIDALEDGDREGVIEVMMDILNRRRRIEDALWNHPLGRQQP